MSYKIVDQIAKSQLASTLKRVLIGYTTFANRDGTGIRPTEAAVGKRAGTSARTVSRHTQALTALGILVHDIDEHGIWLKHAYGDNGVWAYCYRIDASKLTDRALVEQWEADNVALLEKRRAAGAKNTKTRWAKGSSGNPSGQSKLSRQEQSKLSITPAEQIGVPLPEQIGVPRSRANCLTDPTPGIPVPKADPSAVSTAVSQNQVSELVSEVRSVASLTILQGTASARKDKPTYDQQSRLWVEAGEFFNSLWPNKPVRDEDISLLLDLAEEMGHGNLVRGGETIKAAWEWNQVHKKGKYLLYSLAELAKALRSTNDRNLLNQMAMHGGCNLCDQGNDSSQGNLKSMDEPPIAPAPQESAAEAEEAALDPELCRQCQNHPRESAQGYCEFCFMNRFRAGSGNYDSMPPTRCLHGYIPPDDCPTCNPPVAPPEANTTCEECKAKFWSQGGHSRFCSDNCKDGHEKKMAAKYAAPAAAPYNGLVAFLEGEPE